MSAMTQPEESSRFARESVSLAALKALGELEGFACGPLSPLARVNAPSGSADPAALGAFLEGLEGDWEWLPPALIDPGRTVALMVGDRNTQLLGQYLWADVAGTSPGFQVEVAAGRLDATGPLTLDDALSGLVEVLGLARVQEPAFLKLRISWEQLWVVAALADAQAVAAALRIAERQSGPVPGLTRPEILSAWEMGTRQPHLGWSVSLLHTLAPDALPADFAGLLAQWLAEMEASGLLTVLSGDEDDALGELCLLGDDLQAFAQCLTGSALLFGLIVQRREGEIVQRAVLAGWRTGLGVWVANLSDSVATTVELVCTGPQDVEDLLRALLDLDEVRSLPDAGDVPEAYRRESLLQALATGQAAAPASGKRFCRHCGAEVSPGARFCPKCGTQR